MKKNLLHLICLFCSYSLSAQPYSIRHGVLFDESNGRECAFFGFNYLAPFAAAYRYTEQLGLDHKAVVDLDIYHMKRLGINAFRIHMFDVEISDGEGNLLENEHLDLMDYTLWKMGQYGIRTLLTPIAYWRTNEKSLSGFSNLYDKEVMSYDPRAIAAQENYLKQLMNHVNPYSGYAYRDDPNIVAIEINNEPWERDKEKSAQVLSYINRMVAAIRSTACHKPLLYNTNQNEWLIDTYMQAPLQGLTFGLYPTGLDSGQDREVNSLPIVSKFEDPHQQHARYRDKIHCIYEFDAADEPFSYMHTAMARSFREAGYQWATMFCYDSYPLAASNVEYKTHYMNLLHTPGKAIGFRIATEAFLSLPRYETYGTYPQNNRFGDFTLVPEQDLVVLNRDTLYCHTNDTGIAPKNPTELRHIAAHGSSPVISYTGTGAYFLDRIEEGIWRLECFPDQLTVADPYGYPHLDRIVSVLQANSRTMEIRLPELTANFFCESVGADRGSVKQAVEGAIDIRPGVYILRSPAKAHTSIHPRQLGQMPPTRPDLDLNPTPSRICLLHEPFTDLTSGCPTKISMQILTPSPSCRATLQVQTPDHQRHTIPLVAGSGFHYVATLPGALLTPGELKYQIEIRDRLGHTTILPGSTDYYTSQIHDRIPEIPLFSYDHPEHSRIWQKLWQPVPQSISFDKDGVTMRCDRVDAGLFLSVKNRIECVQTDKKRFKILRLDAELLKDDSSCDLFLIDSSGRYWYRKTPVDRSGTTRVGLDEFAPLCFDVTEMRLKELIVDPEVSRNITPEDLSAILVRIDSGSGVKLKYIALEYEP